MISKFLMKKLVPQITPYIKPGLEKLIEKGKEYKASVQLEQGEVTVVGIVIIEGDKCVISPCAMRMSERGKLEVSRSLHHFNAAELADLLIKNIGEADLPLE
jgi:hypothetical protein